MKHIQLAKLYKGGNFFDYGLAVDGKLLEQQVDTTITTEPNKLPTINASFYPKE